MSSLVIPFSIDTTCTVWNLDTSMAVTQLITHDREVYDVAWLPNSAVIFVSVGALRPLNSGVTYYKVS
jgi:DDB1- and CUL4-associated factor 7